MCNFLTYNIFLVTYKHLNITVIELLLAQCQDTAGLCETTEKILLCGETPSKSIAESSLMLREKPSKTENALY